MSNRFLFWVVAFIGFTDIYAQPDFSITGTITDYSGQKVVGANILNQDSNIGTVSNAQGYFKLSGLKQEKFVLRISSIGFATINQPVLLTTEMPSVNLSIQLSESLYELPEIIVSRETLTGGGQFLTDIPGSAHYIGPRELNKFTYSDVNRILRNIPGINIQEEEGFGLRPNIGMRGTGVERSSKITLMEDGILAAPAPYAAPSAYYFPTAGRMQGVEVRKGSSQVKYGPYTTGGAINFLSSQIPGEFSARVNLMAGNFGRRITHASIGQSFEYGGFLLETYQTSADGFKKLDNGGPTGFSNSDYLAKVRINTPASVRVYQSLTFKIGQATGNADETYLGLTEEDFSKTPNRRYSGSQVDNIQTKHNQYSVKYNVIPAKFLDISLTAYQNEFSRNWYKLDGVKYGTDPKVSIASILDDPYSFSNEYFVLTGTTSPTADALYVKANNRKYYSRGIQLITGFNFSSAKTTHDIEVGLRIHQDQEDRFQWEDQYAMESGVMKLTAAGAPGSESNRLSTAKANAAYFQYSLKAGKFSALPGIRFEQIEMLRDDYGKVDLTRSGVNLLQKSNKVNVWIPGIGVEYAFTNTVHAFAGMHKGFAPQGFDKDDKPEESINYEFGARVNKSIFNTQAVAFFNDYSNLLGADLAASGGGGTGDLFNAGKAIVYGLEFEMCYHIPIGNSGNFVFPISIAYTYTDGTFENSFVADNQDWGTVQIGDHLPYLANNQLTLNAGLQRGKFDFNISSKYVGAMRTSPGKGDFDSDLRLESNFIIDISSNFRISRFLTAFGSINNVTDQVYAVARRPAGLRPGMPRSLMIGLKASF